MQDHDRNGELVEEGAPDSRAGEVAADDSGDVDGTPIADEPSGPSIAGVPLDEVDHDEILRLLIGEGNNAAVEIFFEAKDPNIDPMLKLKLVGLASGVGDYVRKAIATYATHFGRKG